MVLAAVLFLATIAGGLLLLALRLLRGRIPLPLALAHGALAATALTALASGLGDGAIPSGLYVAVVAFGLAVVLGGVLFVLQLGKRTLPIWLILLHGSIALVGTGLALGSGCHRSRPSAGGGDVAASDAQRRWNPADVSAPAQYVVEHVISGLTYPTGVTFDEEGTPYVVEAGYSYGEDWVEPRLLRIRAGAAERVAAGGRNGPWNGVAFHEGAFFVAEGGQSEGGRILKITPDGASTALVEGLPSLGDHHTNGPVVGPDGWIYFGQGTATNSGVVGPDNVDFGWVARHPEFHDIPGGDLTLADTVYESADPRAEGARATTSALAAFGTSATRNQVVPGRVPCTGAILRVRPDGGEVELTAWGLRNPFGLAFSPDGQLYTTDNAFDDRGSRPIFGAPDVLWRVESGRWYGWPDYAGGRPVDTEEFQPPGGAIPRRLLAKDPSAPPRPVAWFGVHSAATGLDFSRSEDFGHRGDAFVALFGDMAPSVGKVQHPVGFKVVRVDLASGAVEDFLGNHGAHAGPASWLGTGGLDRPIAARFSPDGKNLYVVDFGILRMEGNKPRPVRGSGGLWRVRREDAR